MAEAIDKDSRTEEPTEKKTRDAIEQGNVPFSREAAMFASLVGILVVSSFFFANGIARLKLSLQRFIDSPGEWPLENGADAINLFVAIGWEAARLMTPAIAVLVITGLAASFLQNAPRLVLRRIQPDASRLSLSKGWQRLFGIQGQVEFLKAMFRLAAVGFVALLLLCNARFDILNALFTDPAAIPGLILSLWMRLVAAVVTAVIVLAAADLVWSRLFWRRELRMTRQELKDEMKQQEGDPIVRTRLRSLQRDRARKRMIAAVPRATLVIANPTHYAVALRYVRKEQRAPLVIAKGQDLIALKIREAAEQHGIPIFEDKSLARSLYESVEVDKLIPPEFYKAVAEIIFFLFFAGRGGATAGR